MNLKYNKGFSLIEMLVVIAILVLMATVITVGLSSFYKGRTLDGAVEQAISLINEARSKTLSSKDSSQYGVHFETSRLALFKGPVFTEPNSDNKEFIFSSSVEMFGTTLNGGGSDLVFKRLTGKTDEYGAVSFRLKIDNSKIKNITIEPGGVVSAD